MKTVLLFLLFTFISIFSINAQRIVGIVVDNDSVPIVGAIVQLKQTDSVTIVNYAITDLLGKWTMNCPKKETYLLSIGSLGCETKMIKILVNVDEYVTFPIMLTPKVAELTVFEVKGQKIYVKQNGDTLTYKVEGFRNGMEDNIGDLLKNIPSVEIGKDGSIKYKGQRVNKILLEEKDIFSNMHKLFTEGINATDVKSVKIIENYKDKNDFGTNNKTGKVAINGF